MQTLPCLIELAKLAAKQNGCDLSQYIQFYEINATTEDGQKALIEIAKIAAKSPFDPYSYNFEMSQYIKNYGINSQTPLGKAGLIEIAKIRV